MKKKRKHNAEADEVQNEERTVGVMFVPYTEDGELARRLRDAENEMGKQTGIKIKIVERTGTRLVDLLPKSDPWQGEDCRRPNCILCETKMKTGKNQRQDCTKRCVVYETWCLTCEKRDREELEKNLDEEEKKIGGKEWKGRCRK